MATRTMSAQALPMLTERYERNSRWLAGAVVGLGVVVLAGWIAQVELLKRIATGFVAMNPLTAVCFAVAGLSVWALRGPGRWLAVGGGALVGALGAWRIVNYVAGWDLALDNVLFTDGLTEDIFPNRMAPNTAICFALVGTAIALVASGRGPALVAGQTLALAAGAICLFALTGYLYQLALFYRVANAIPMALHTAVGFLVLAVAVVLHRTEEGALWVLADDSAGGHLARRLVGLAIIVPLALGWLRLWGERAGLYPTDFGAALFAGACTALFAALIFAAATRIARLEHAQRRFEAALRESDLKLHREEARRESEERFRMAAECSNDLIFVYDVSSDRVEWHGVPENGAAGGLHLPATGEEWLARINPGQRAHIIRARERTDRTGERFQEEYEINVQEGPPRRWFVRGAVIRQGDRPIRWVGTVTDVTEQRRIEDQLRQAQKMEAVGQLAGGVAHDFNNLLQVILGRAHFALTEIPPGTTAHEDLLEIQAAADRATGVTRQLLSFSRRQIAQRVPVDLARLVEELIRMVGRLLGSDIEIAFTPGKDVPVVMGDPGQIEQIVMNLCVNARDAMSEGGRLVLELRGVTLDEDFCRTHPWAKEGRFALLSVTDNGEGIPPEVQTRIFEPFFTTKEPGKGTGMGLATVYGIVQSHGGLIHVYSEAGVGTTFKVYLPGAGAAAEDVARQAVRPVIGGTETVLLAEDEEMVRGLAAQVLEGAGYRVLTAANGDEALDVFASQGGQIDIALLDVIMPGQSGLRVAEQVRRRSAGLPVILTSGHSIEAAALVAIAGPVPDVFEKPYSPTALLRRVREALDRAARA